MNAEDPREKLAREIAPVTWRQLRPHAADNRLFLVEDGLELLEAGVALASDDGAAVQRWIEAGQLVRPSAEQIRDWESGAPGFRFLILSPFVVAEILGVE